MSNENKVAAHPRVSKLFANPLNVMTFQADDPEPGLNLMVFYPDGASTAPPELRVWLGGGNGWSLPLQLPSAPPTPLKVHVKQRCPSSP